MVDLYSEKTDVTDEKAARRLHNAILTLKVRCKVKPGESVVIVCARREGDHPGGPNLEICQTLSRAARELGAYPMLVDVADFREMPEYKESKGFAAVREALLNADVVVGNEIVYKNLGLGQDGSGDVHLLGERRWFTLQLHMNEWELDEEEIAAIVPTTDALCELVQKGKTFRLTSPNGTDFTFETISAMPIRAIIPNYGELSIMPKYGSGNGVVVIDGPTQCGVRRKSELDREPLRIVFKDGEVVSYTGDPEQVARLKKFIENDDPHGKFVDEVGIPTTRARSNNMCWGDGTHNTQSIHVAIGNNNLRDKKVHGNLHMDMEVRHPTFYIDGKVVIEDTKFVF